MFRGSGFLQLPILLFHEGLKEGSVEGTGGCYRSGQFADGDAKTSLRLTLV